VTVCDENTDLGVAQAAYIRHRSGRSFTETRTGSGLVTFTFGPGQEPFPGGTHEHRVRVERPELFEVIGGDWRGNPRRKAMTHNSPEDWVEDFAEHQDRLATRQSRG